MDNGIYIALSKQLAQFRQMAVIAGNVANVNTAGYQGDQMLFRDYLAPDVNRKKNTFTQDYDTYRDTKAGKMIVTGNPLDLAIVGKGYFEVETPLGRRFTRAGNFTINGQNTLVNAEGYPVMMQGGQPLQLEEDDVVVEVREDGVIMVDGEERGNISVVDFENEQLLQKVGNSLYSSEEDPLPIEVPTVAQGTLEGSNVEPVSEITQMITTMRRVGVTSDFIDTSYELERKAMSVLAKQNR